MSQNRFESWSRAASFSLKVIGILGIIFVPVFWAFTGKFEPTFLPFFGLLAGVGEGINVAKEMVSNRDRGGGKNDST